MSTLLEQASLVMIPSGYKEDVVYSQIPTNGNGDLSFTRASNGTRVNSAGLVEVCPWNLVTYSEEFSNAIWSKGFSSITANATIAPNGTTTADKLVENNTTNQHFAQQVVTVDSSNIYTITVYAKASERSRVNLLIAQSTSPFTNLANVTYDLLAGTISDTIVGTGSITSVGNGWFRCVATGIATPSTGAIARVSLALTNNSDNYLGDGTSGAFIWGAQLNIGSTAKPYFPTTDRLNVPRLTYQNGGGGCPSLLLEPQRTNVETWSEDFSNVAWTKTNCSITANTTISPDGTADADKIIENSANGVHFVFNVGATISVAQTLSVYAKADTRTQLALQLGASSVIYNLSSGTIVSGSGGTITSVGNGWYRCAITTTPANTNALIFTANGGTNSYQGDGTSGLFIWGAQLESGAYATTYIPTTAASATRVADSFSRNNIYTNGLITSSGGTWFVELRDNIDLIRNGSAGGIFINTGTLSLDGNGFLLRNPTSASQKISIAKYISGTGTTLFNSTTSTLKVAIKWNGSTADIFVNGTKEVSATTFTTTAMENLISEGTNRTLLISQMDLFPTPLTDAECIALTTL
jgi:hypothetical protein